LCDGQVEILRPGPITEQDLRGMGFQPMEWQSASDHRQDADATIPRGIGFQPMNPREAISVRYGGNLPHWTQQDATYSVVFRLADALPVDVIAEWERERRDIRQYAKEQNRDLSP